MATLDMTTMVIPCLAAIKLCPTCLPSSVSSMIPSWSSSLLMRGMLTLWDNITLVQSVVKWSNLTC